MSETTDYSRVAVQAVDCIMAINPARLRRAQAGSTDSSNVGIPWPRFLALVDAIEAANPGWIDRAYDIGREGAK